MSFSVSRSDWKITKYKITPNYGILAIFTPHLNLGVPDATFGCAGPGYPQFRANRAPFLRSLRSLRNARFQRPLLLSLTHVA